MVAAMCTKAALRVPNAKIASWSRRHSKRVTDLLRLRTPPTAPGWTNARAPLCLHGLPTTLLATEARALSESAPTVLLRHRNLLIRTRGRHLRTSGCGSDRPTDSSYWTCSEGPIGPSVRPNVRMAASINLQSLVGAWVRVMLEAPVEPRPGGAW